jgi:cell division protein FtsN
MKQQRGGTLLGIIIGVVVGLGVALSVALYVNKVPVPFLNKGQSRTPEQDAAEAKKNKEWDPNAPLYSKGTVKPVTPPASAPVATPAPSKPEKKAVATAPARSENKPAVSADPLGDLARAKAAAAEPFAYFVQVGAYRAQEDAESQRAKLSLAGVEARVTEREQSGRQIFRVRVGPFDKKDEAEQTKVKLEAAGYETALVRVQR